MPTTATVTIGAAPVRPSAGTEPVPSSNYPPSQTVTLSGTQTTQYRPNALSDRRFDLTGAVWNNAPNSLLYPIVVDDGGSNTPNGHDTILQGARINGTLNLGVSRDEQYLTLHSGIEHNCDSATGYIIGQDLYVDRMMDGYRVKGEGTAYLKRAWVKDILDDGIEMEKQFGDTYIYDSLFEGCATGLSDKLGGAPHLGRLEVDGLLLWLRPTVDTPESQGGTNCSSTGCDELNTQWSDGSYRSTFAVWKGDADSRNTIVVRNSWFRIDRVSTYGPNAMRWPGGASGSTWGSAVNATYENVKVLWTGLDTSFRPTSTAYPGPALPSGVELVTGPVALNMWNRAAASWKAAHGY